MPTSPLPENASLEHLKGQAKLVRDLVRARDQGALSMVDEFHPRMNATDIASEDAEAFKLSDAQLIVARMYRCTSWAKLRDHVAVVQGLSFTPRPERPGYVDFDESFVELGCLLYAENGPSPDDRIARAHELLASNPSVASESLAAVITVGDHQALAQTLKNDPQAANRPCGPNNWPPLLYATYSRIKPINPAWSAVKTVETLLAAGADPNAGFLWRGLVPPFTALTGAFGNGESHQPRHADRFTIARLLLEAGADPNDGQTLYNNGIGGQNHDDPTHLEMLLEFGLGTHQNGPWYQRLGDRLADPSEWLHHELEAAVMRGRPNHLRLLIRLGADLDQPVGRSQMVPVRLAAEHGQHEILNILAGAGVDTALTPVEEFLDAIRTSDDERLRNLLATHPNIAKTAKDNHPGAIKNVTSNGDAVLKTLLTLGLNIDARTGGNGTTALHVAAQANDVPRAQLLIKHGADPNLVDNYVGATPWGWASHNHHDEVADYLRPLTTFDEPIDITITSLSTTSNITTISSLDETLDQLATTNTPALIRLTSDATSLSIGVGGTHSVALYLDTKGQSWHATNNTAPDKHDTLIFESPKGETHFEPALAISQYTARSIARTFAQQPTRQPPQVTWVREGPGQTPIK